MGTRGPGHDHESPQYSCGEIVDGQILFFLYLITFMTEQNDENISQSPNGHMFWSKHTGKGGVPSGRQFHCLWRRQLEGTLWALGKCKGLSGKLIPWDIYLVASDYELTLDCKLLFPISWLIRKCAPAGSVEPGCGGNFDTQMDFFLNSPRHSFSDSSFLTGNTMSPFSSVLPGLLRTWPLRERRKKGRSRGCGRISIVGRPLYLPFQSSSAYFEYLAILSFHQIWLWSHVAKASTGEIWQNNIVWKRKGSVSGSGDWRAKFKSLSGHFFVAWFWAIPHLIWKPVFSLLTEVRP